MVEGIGGDCLFGEMNFLVTKPCVVLTDIDSKLNCFSISFVEITVASGFKQI